MGIRWKSLRAALAQTQKNELTIVLIVKRDAQISQKQVNSSKTTLASRVSCSKQNILTRTYETLALNQLKSTHKHTHIYKSTMN